MKKIKIAFLILLTGIITSCSWLDLAPEDNYSIDNYWNTQDQVDRFIRGIHNRVRMRQFTFLTLGEFRGGSFDESLVSPFAQNKSDINIIANNLSVQNYGVGSFGNFYMDIMQINHAIVEIPKVTFLTEVDKNYYLGMLHGLRSFYYFHLFRSWGGVPLIDYPEVLAGVSSPDVLNKPRATEAETFEFIKRDIKKSAEYYTDDNFSSKAPDFNSFWNKAATNVLKAEILLWGSKVKPIGGTTVYSKNKNSDLLEAKATLLEIVNSQKFKLIDEYSNIFDVDNKNNSEIIFSIRYALNEATNSFNQFLYPQSSGNANGFENRDGSLRYGDNASPDPLNLANSGSHYGYQYSYSTFEMFDDKDTRKDVTFLDLYRTSDRSVIAIMLTKFLGEMDESNFRRFTNDWPIYRYSDVLLLLAEVEDGLNGDPSSYINDVRRRAYGNSYEDFKFPYNGESTEDAILDERTKEFIAEGKRWYDIRRMKNGELAKELQANVSGNKVEQHLLWPVDASTLARDPLVLQTEGY